MTVKLLLKYVNIANLATSVTLLTMMWRKRYFEDFRYFGLLITCHVIVSSIAIPLLFFRKQFHIPPMLAWKTYWYTSSISFGFEMVLEVLTIYAIYRLAMRGLEGLQRIGQILFRWIAGVSFGLAVFFAVGPHLTSNYIAVITSQIHQGISVLSLCLLLFVCLALRPLGLTFGSRIFGVSLGLGVTASTTLVEAAWLPTPEGHSLYSPLFLLTGIASLVAVTIWTIYFALPEPERRMVLLPTTSPFFVWNSISEALGDEPGYVAVSGFTPDMLSQAEIEELSRSSHRDTDPDKSKPDDDDDDDSSGGPLKQALALPPFATN